MTSSKNFVGFLNRTAVLAFPIEMLAPAANVPSSLSSAMRFPPSSTTATTPVAFDFFASACAAAMTLRAPSRLSVFFCVTWAGDADAAARERRAAARMSWLDFIAPPLQNEVSPRSVSAHAHQICTFATSWT
jgi:hypothetical protein